MQTFCMCGIKHPAVDGVVYTTDIYCLHVWQGAYAMHGRVQLKKSFQISLRTSKSDKICMRYNQITFNILYYVLCLEVIRVYLMQILSDLAVLRLVWKPFSGTIGQCYIGYYVVSTKECDTRYIMIYSFANTIYRS